MLAARGHQGETELRLEQVDRPVPSAGEVVIEVVSAGMPAGLLELWIRGLYPLLPQTLGHEAAGRIAAVGGPETGFSPGDRVRLHPNLTCRRCEFCLTDREQMCPACSMIGQGSFGPLARPLYERYHHGALAEYVLAPVWAVDRLSERISFDVAAKVHDVAVALRALKIAVSSPGATVVLTAATGTVGTSMIRIARLLGVKRLIAIARSTERLEGVRALDPELVDTIALDQLDADWGETQALTRAIRESVPAGPDAVVDLLPEGPGTWQAIASLKTGGTAVVMGSNLAMPSVPTMAIMAGCWRIVGSRNCTREDTRQIMCWLEDGTLVLDDLITHRFKLRDIAAAVTAVRRRPEPTWMLAINP
jgi:threonine dehydrogenase-like Zn-dependent dehydrogenase